MAYELTSSITPNTASATTIGDAEWGIDNVLTVDNSSVWIVQSESLLSDLVTDTTQDQKGRVIGQLDYDKHFTCQLDIIGSGTLPAVGSTDCSYASRTWKVQSITYNGSYNDKKKYSISLEAWEHFPVDNS